MWISLLLLHHALAAPPAEAPSNAWATDSVDMQRFAGADTKVGTLSSGDKVEVLVIDGDLARVRKEVIFGWVPLDKLSTDEPTAEEMLGGDATPAPAGDPKVPEYDLGKGPPKL